MQSLCHFQVLFSKREQTCHAFTQAASMEQVSQESQEHILKSSTWAVPKCIDADKASAPCYCVHTRRPACDPCRPGEYWGAREVRDDLFPTNVTSLRHFVRAPMQVSSMKFWIPGAEVPQDSYSVTSVRNRTRLGTHDAKSSQTVPDWLMASIRNIYRTDILTTINDNWLPSSKCGRRDDRIAL